MRSRIYAAALLAGTLLTAAPAAAGPIFVLNNLGGVEAGSAARRGFERAAAMWASVLTDDVVVRLDVGFRSLGSGILGSTRTSRSDVDYRTVRSALHGDRSSELDRTAVASLSRRLQFWSNEAGNCATGAGCRPVDRNRRAWDADGTRDNLFLTITAANQKALGLREDTGARDAGIYFSDDSRWDFDRSDGITRGAFDFVGVAAHEIGHALGFTSGVDLADAYQGQIGLDGIAWGTVLDLFRYQNGQRDWTIGGAPCISPDGGDTCLGLTATGAQGGDGHQASHWKNNRSLGLMDPTAANGELLELTDLDLFAFDMFGWDIDDDAFDDDDGDDDDDDGKNARQANAYAALSWGDNLMWAGDEFATLEMASEWRVAAVPAPASLALFGLGLLALCAARSRRRG